MFSNLLKYFGNILSVNDNNAWLQVVSTHYVLESSPTVSNGSQACFNTGKTILVNKSSQVSGSN